MSTNQKSFEKAFYADGYKLGIRAVEKNLDRKALFSAIEKMHEAIDALINSLFEFANQQNQPIDCKKDCEWCCHQPVFAMDYELDFLNDFLKRTFSETNLSSLRNRAAKKNKKLAGLAKETQLNSKYPCPLLENGSCIAYIVRPVACRIYLSTNVKTCLNFFNKAFDKSNYPALLNFPMRAGRMMNEGFKAALKMGGFDAQEFRIEEKLGIGL